MWKASCVGLKLVHGLCARPFAPAWAMNRGSRSAAMTRSLILPMENPFRASPNSSICGTDCAGALPAASIAISLREIRSITRRNTTATARWDVERRGGAQGHGRSRSLGHRRRQALFGAQPLLAAGMARKREGAYPPGRPRLGRPSKICRHRRSSGRRAPLLRPRPRSRCAMAAIGSSSAARSRATRPAMSSAKAICRRRSNKLARTSMPASRPAARRSRTLFLRSSHVTQPAEFDKYADLLPALFRSAFAEEHDGRHAIGQPGSPVAGRSLRGDQVRTGLQRRRPSRSVVSDRRLQQLPPTFSRPPAAAAAGPRARSTARRRSRRAATPKQNCAPPRRAVAVAERDVVPGPIAQPVVRLGVDQAVDRGIAGSMRVSLACT